MELDRKACDLCDLDSLVPPYYEMNQDSDTEIRTKQYYSDKIDIIPKRGYNVLESEVYSLCI